MDWKFERQDDSFEVVPVGTHRVRIEGVEKAISQNGNDMLVLELAVSNYKSHIWDYIVFLADKPEITNAKLTKLFDSFGIEDGDFNTANWIGKAGACVTKLDEYDGKEKAKVNYYIHKRKQVDLPPFVDKNGDKPGTPAPKMPKGQELPDDRLPF